MQAIVTTNNSTVLRELGTPPFQRLALAHHVARDGAEVLALITEHRPGVALVDVELPGASGYDLSRRIKDDPELGSTRVVLLLEGAINAQVIEELSRSRCDEVLVTPVTGDALFYKITQLMGIPRRVRRRMSVSLQADVAAERMLASGRVVDLSQDGARLRLEREVPRGETVQIRIAPGGEGETVAARAEVVWSVPEEDGKGWACGVKFLTPDLAVRTALMDLSLWDVAVEPDGSLLVTFQGDFREHTDFTRLVPRLSGRVTFDLAWVRYLNSAGVRHWVNFVRALDALESYEFVRCSVAFVTQASMVPELLGRGQVESFMVPFACEGCEFEEERLVQTPAFAVPGQWPPALPVFMCPRCGDELAFDDVPARYFAFLQSDPRIAPR